MIMMTSHFVLFGLQQFMHRLLHNEEDPYDDIGDDQVHQPELGHKRKLSDVQPRVHHYSKALEDDEDSEEEDDERVEQMVGVIAGRIAKHLKRRSKLHQSVHNSSQSEHDGSLTKESAAVTLVMRPDARGGAGPGQIDEDIEEEEDGDEEEVDEEIANLELVVLGGEVDDLGSCEGGEGGNKEEGVEGGEDAAEVVEDVVERSVGFILSGRLWVGG